MGEMLHVYNGLKHLRRRMQFKKFARYGEDFATSHASGCFADAPGLITIGNHCDITGTLYSMGSGTIRIGDYTEIREDSFVGSVSSVEIGSYVMISNSVRIFDNNNHPTDPEIRKKMCKDGFYGDAWRWTHAQCAPVVIRDNVWIGERSTILKNVTIGEGSVVACNSVVTKDIPPYCIAAGNPARVVKYLEHHE